MRFFVTLLLAVLPFAVSAQGWKPTKDVEFVIPFAVGGGADLMARVIHKIIAEEKLVPVPVALVNKPGGGGAVGIGYVSASRKADPHTLILINGTTQITPILNPKAKTLTEVQPVMNVMLDDFVFFVNGRRAVEDRRRLRRRRQVEAGEDLQLRRRRHHRRHGGDRALEVRPASSTTSSASTAAARRSPRCSAATCMPRSATRSSSWATCSRARCARSACSATAASPRCPTCRP